MIEDEFTVVLTGRDYENRHWLMRELHARSTAHISTQDTTQVAIVSGGMAEYIPGQDHHLHEVFERADSAMYEEKMLLKSLGAATRDDEAERAEEDEDLAPWEKVTASIGYAIFSADRDGSPYETFRRADSEMYLHKQERKAQK